MTNMQIAQTILDQLGGRAFVAMTGAKNFIAGESQLMFQIPKAAKGVNKVRVILMPNDTYKVEFAKVAKLDYKVIKTVENVYCDMLQDVFEENTGLYTSL